MKASNVKNVPQEGLDRLSASFPWIAGQVVNEGASMGDPGTFHVAPSSRTPALVVNDLRDDDNVLNF